jgi:arsenate reductase
VRRRQSPGARSVSRASHSDRDVSCRAPIRAWHETPRQKDADDMKIVIYQKPTCTTCRQVHAALVDSGVDFDAVDYYIDPIPKKKLLDLLRKMGLPPRELLRTKEPIYKTLRLSERNLTDDEIVDVMVENPDLIQRPIVEKGARAILARPPERLKEIL